MYSKLLFLIVSLICANALSIGDVGMAEVKIETFNAVEGNFTKAAGVPNTTWPVSFFYDVEGQGLSGQALKQSLPAGTGRVRITFTPGSPAPSRITQVYASVDISSTDSISSIVFYTRQYDKHFQGDIVFNSTLTHHSYISWYAFAIE